MVMGYTAMIKRTKMKNNLLLPLIGIIAITIYSCKLDPPILPAKAPATGSGVVTVINNVNLTGTYYLLSDDSQYYNAQTDTPYANTEKYPALFKRIILNDSTKTAVVTSYTNSDTNYTYILTLENNNTYITFNADMFSRSVNYKIQITSFAGNTMKWLAIDPNTFTYESAMIYNAYAVTFTKESGN